MAKFTALSVVAPAGERLASGEKQIEVRKWRPEVLPLRDVLLIQNKVRLDALNRPEDPDGFVVAMFDVLEIREWQPADALSGATPWIPGYFAWVLTNVRRVSVPIPCIAKRRLYMVELDAPPIICEPAKTQSHRSRLIFDVSRKE